MTVARSSAADPSAAAEAPIAIVSDTHFPRRGRRLPEPVRDRLRDAAAIIHAGDLCDAELLAELESFGRPVHAVLGNNDQALAGILPEARTVAVGGLRIGVLHDAGARRGRLERLRRRFPDHDAVVFGHSHLPLHEHDGGFQIFNPGSATDRRGRWPVHTMGELRVVDGAARFALIELGP